VRSIAIDSGFAVWIVSQRGIQKATKWKKGKRGEITPQNEGGNPASVRKGKWGQRKGRKGGN